MKALDTQTEQTTSQWTIVRELAADLADGLALARGPARLSLARSAVRDARDVLERMTGPEAESTRMLLAAVEAATREPGAARPL